MSESKCPKCGEKYPQHTSWTGGDGVVVIGCCCKKCGHHWDSKSKVNRRRNDRRTNT